MKTVLFAWELGGGSGHIANIRRYATTLCRNDWRLVAAVKAPGAARSLSEAGIEVLQAPAWAEASFTPGQRATLSSATMGDSLATLGLGYPDALAALLAGWQRILRDVAPDLVVADYAPAASLLARGRIPLLLAGNGYTLPPADLIHFPRLHRAPPVWEESRLLTILNKTGRAYGAQALERLPQLFAADACQVETVPLLDPYDLQRSTAVDGPVFDTTPRARKQNAEDVVVYLARSVSIHPDIPDALLPLSRHIQMYAPGLSVAQRADFESRGAHVHSAPLDLSDALESARLAVHLGGSGLASHAIAAGVPQLVFSVHVEQALNGLALERHGIGRLIRSHDPAASITAEDVSGVLEDSALASRATQAGELHRSMLRHSAPLAAFEAKALGLLNAGPATSR